MYPTKNERIVNFKLQFYKVACVMMNDWDLTSAEGRKEKAKLLYKYGFNHNIDTTSRQGRASEHPTLEAQPVLFLKYV